MKRFFVIFCCGMLALHAAEPPSAPAALPDKNELNSILASVNGKAISLGDVLEVTSQQERLAFASVSGKKLENAIRKLRKEAVDQLIDEKLIIADYRKGKYQIPSHDVEYELDRVAERMGCRSREEFRRKLEDSGVDLQELRTRQENNMIVQYMIFRRISIGGTATPKELYDYFNAHKEELSGRETVTLAMLKLPKDMAENDRKKAETTLTEHPERFAGLVREITRRNDGGRLGEIECGKLRPDFAAKITDYTPGKVYGPIPVEDGTVWLQVLEHKTPVEVRFADVEQQIRRKFAEEQRQNALKQYTAQLRSRALIEYFF